jgi:NAD(P)H-flavin reductase
MCLMLGASVFYFRERWYDLFLIVHIVMSVGFFVALWFHVRIFNGEFNYYLYPCIGIWALDRVLRTIRTVVVSVMPRFANGVKATATYNRNANMIRLDITDFFPNTNILPGIYYYIYLPAGIRGYESHPMTVCSWRRSASTPPASPRLSLQDKDVSTSVRPVSDDDGIGEIAHTFLIRPYKGMTGRLQQKLTSAPEAIASSRETIFLEGPYGSPVDLSGYSDVLVLCGGSGITAAISHAYFLISANTSTRIHISWAVPQRALPDDICAHEFAAVIYSDRLQMTVYLTSSAGVDDAERKRDDRPSPYEIRSGRPNFEAIIREKRSLAVSSLAVVSCGTPRVSDLCRAAVVKVLEEEGKEVGWFNETLMW